MALNGEAGNGLVKIRSQFIGNETSGARDAQVVATASGKGCLKERLEVFVERSRLVVVGIDDDDDHDDDDDVGGNDGGECRGNEQDSRAKLRRKRKKGDAKRNRVDILDDEMAAEGEVYAAVADAADDFGFISENEPGLHRRNKGY